MKLSAVPTLFSYSNPKQKRECSIKRSDIGDKKQVVNMFRSNHQVQNLYKKPAKEFILIKVTGLSSEHLRRFSLSILIIGVELRDYFSVVNSRYHRSSDNFSEANIYNIYEVTSSNWSPFAIHLSKLRVFLTCTSCPSCQLLSNFQNTHKEKLC